MDVLERFRSSESEVGPVVLANFNLTRGAERIVGFPYGASDVDTTGLVYLGGCIAFNDHGDIHRHTSRYFTVP